jgi:hypothetical protein
MFQYKDPTGAARAAVIAVGCFAVSDLLASIAAFFMPPNPAEFSPADLLTMVNFFIVLASLILVGRWIYRTNANAHSFSDAVSITPGWAIGWFFVPFANLVKPYEGVKETWKASHQVAGRFEELESPLLPWWWGLWLATNAASGISARIGAMSGEPMAGLLGFDIFVSIANVGLCVVLIQLMTHLSRTQVAASQSDVFA